MLSGFDKENNAYIVDTGNHKVKKYSSTGAWLLTIGATNDFHGNDLSGTSAYLSSPNMITKESMRYWANEYSYISASNEYTIEDNQGNFYFMDGNTRTANFSCAGKQLRKYSSTGAFLLRVGSSA